MLDWPTREVRLRTASPGGPGLDAIADEPLVTGEQLGARARELPPGGRIFLVTNGRQPLDEYTKGFALSVTRYVAALPFPVRTAESRSFDALEGSFLAGLTVYVLEREPE